MGLGEGGGGEGSLRLSSKKQVFLSFTIFLKVKYTWKDTFIPFFLFRALSGNLS